MHASTSTVRRARPDEASVISELALRSKAHWGYSSDEMAVFRAELTMTSEDVRDGETYVVGGPNIAGFYSLEETESGGLGLGHMFVRPECLRSGYGRMLLAHALRRAAESGFDRLEIVADQHAEQFYLRMGARRVGEVESSIPGRYLPVLEHGVTLE